MNNKQSSELLKKAAQDGNLKEVKRLLPVSDPKADDSMALSHAASHGHTECVKLLLPVSDPKTNNSEAIILAARSEYKEIVQILLPVSNYKTVLQNLVNDNEDITFIQQCVDEYEALQQKNSLNKTLAETVEKKGYSLKRKI